MATPVPAQNVAITPGYNMSELKPGRTLSEDGKTLIITNVYLEAGGKFYELTAGNSNKYQFNEVQADRKEQVKSFFDAKPDEQKSQKVDSKESSIKRYELNPCVSQKPLTVEDMNEKLMGDDKIHESIKAFKNSTPENLSASDPFNSFLSFFDLVTAENAAALKKAQLASGHKAA